MSNLKSSVSFVIPCLNEQDALADVLAKINKVRETNFRGLQTEVIVSDNGSTDNSVKIAKEHGAKVVYCTERGYGAALSLGIKNAACETVVFADADNTYDFLETPRLVNELEKGFDLVIGSRIEGDIHSGAMPFLHRHLGTPILNFLINLLYAKEGNKITDCNSGFHCFKRDSFLSWGVKSQGMEFASEMLIKALKSNAKISHVPISLYPDLRHRVPHLKDGRVGESNGSKMQGRVTSHKKGWNYSGHSGIMIAEVSGVSLSRVICEISAYNILIIVGDKYGSKSGSYRMRILGS